MKIIKNFLFIPAAILILSLSFSSCHAIKKASIACPEFSQSRLVKRTAINNRNKIILANRVNRKNNSDRSTGFQNFHHDTDLKKSKGFLKKEGQPNSVIIDDLTKTDYLNNLVASVSNTIIVQPATCDTIFLLSGKWMNVKIATVRQDKIEYRNCDSLLGPTSSILKADVSYIKYYNGARQPIAKCDTIFLIKGGWRCVKIVKETQDKLMFRNYDNLTGPIITISKSDLSAVKYYIEERVDTDKNIGITVGNVTNNEIKNAEPPGITNIDTIPPNINKNEIRTTEPLAVVSFVSVLTALIFGRLLVDSHPLLWLLLILMGPILGSASISKIKKHPEKYKGRKLAKFSRFVSLIVLALMIFIALIAFFYGGF